MTATAHATTDYYMYSQISEQTKRFKRAIIGKPAKRRWWADDGPLLVLYALSILSSSS